MRCKWAHSRLDTPMLPCRTQPEWRKPGTWMTEYDRHIACNKCLLAPMAKAKLHSHQSEFSTNDLTKLIWPLMMISQLRLKVIRLRKPPKTTTMPRCHCFPPAGHLLVLCGIGLLQKGLDLESCVNPKKPPIFYLVCCMNLHYIYIYILNLQLL